jgi:thermitase
MSSTRFLLLALFFLISSGLQNNPVVTWSPSHLTKTALIGTSSSVDITFTCDRELNNVTVRVVPELASVVSVTPSRFEKIELGTVQTVKVTFSVPKNAPIQTLRGTIYLKEGSKTIARPLPVELNIKAPTATEVPQSIALPSQDRISTVPNENSMPFVTDEITIILKDGVCQDVIMQLVSQFGAVFLGSAPEIGLYQIVVREEGFENLLSIASQLQEDPNIELATLHFLFRTGNFPNDPGTDLSYGPDLVKLPLAWDITNGKKEVIIGPRDVEKINIAVVDTVFDFDHVDLKANITKHTTNSASFGEPNHGTRVASIVGAQGNNGIGIAGAMWDAALHLYSVGDSKDPTKFDSALMIVAFSQAIRDGARVVNFSGGQNCGQSICTAEGERALQEMDKFVTYFINLAKARLGKNLLWVFAAGNENKNLRTQSPARLSATFDNVVSVSAVDSQKKLASFSNFGHDVTVAAPGVRIFTLVPGGGFNDGTFNIPIINWKLDSYGSGTSYSAPYVTGVAGLMLSVNPSLTASQIKLIIRDSAEHTGNLDPDGNEVRLLNAFQAVERSRELNNPSFGPIVNLSNNPAGTNVEDIQIATSGTNVYVVWENNSGGNLEIFFARSTDDGVTWSSPINLSESVAASRWAKLAAVGTSVYVVWGEGPSIFADQTIKFRSSSDLGTTFGTVQHLSAVSDPFNNRPQLAASSNNVYVSWSSFSGINPVALFRRSVNAGSSFDPAQLLWSGNTNTLAVSGNNVYVAGQAAPTSFAVFRRSTDAGFTFNSALQFLPIATGTPVLVATDSNVYLFWYGQGVGFADLFFAGSLNNGSSFSPAIPLSSNNNIVDSPAIAASGRNIAVAWHQAPFSQTLISGSVNSGASFYAPEVFTGPSISGFPSLISLGGTTVAAAWSDNAIHFSESNDMGQSFQDDPLTLSIQGINFGAKLAISNSHVYVVWRSFNLTRTDVVLRRRAF